MNLFCVGLREAELCDTGVLGGSSCKPFATCPSWHCAGHKEDHLVLTHGVSAVAGCCGGNSVPQAQYLNRAYYFSHLAD